MKKLSVSDYAKEFKTSVQSVYQRIKRGSLKSVEENGIKYVLIEEESIKDDLNPEFKVTLNRAFKTIEYLQNENKAMRKEIKRLTKELSRAQSGKSEVLEKFIFEMQRLAAPVQDQEEVIIEVKDKKKKKKKSKSNKKKK